MYIEKTDIEKGMYPEVLAIISRADINIETAIAEAIEEVDSYLSVRYDTASEFAKTGSARNNLVVKMVRSITLYNIYNISNPVNMPESRSNDYKATISQLKDIQAERAQIKGLARLTDTDGSSNYLKFGGNAPRKNHY